MNRCHFASKVAVKPFTLVSGEVMSELAQTVTPQGLLAVCDFVDVPLDRVAATKPRLVALLANVRDPGNAGTVLRTADAAGADAVVFADASVREGPHRRLANCHAARVTDCDQTLAREPPDMKSLTPDFSML